MPRQPNIRMVGIFMVSGIIAFLAVSAVYLRRQFSNDEHNMIVMYFEESIKGLSVGSPVVFKGVEIGKVAKIELIADANDLNFSIPVYARIESHQDNQGLHMPKNYHNRQEMLDEFIDKGLRARLAPQNYLTGQLIIELEMLPDTKIVLKNEKVNEDNGILEIPTVLSPLGEISKGFQSIQFKQSLEKLNLFIDQLNKEVPIILPQITKTLKSIDSAVANNRALATDSLNNFNKAMINISEAAKSFRNFSDYMERHPEAILKGKQRSK